MIPSGRKEVGNLTSFVGAKQPLPHTETETELPEFSQKSKIELVVGWSRI